MNDGASGAAVIYCRVACLAQPSLGIAKTMLMLEYGCAMMIVQSEFGLSLSCPLAFEL